MRTVLRFLVAAFFVALTAPSALAADAGASFFQLNTGNLQSELDEARQAGRKGVLIMFEQEGCPGCLFMKENVLNRPDVQRHYRDRLVSLSVDIYGAVPFTALTGRELTEKSFAQSLGIKATPTFLYFDLDGREAARIVGPVRNPAEFMLLADYVASGAYRTRNFSQYKQAHSPKGS